MTLFRPFRARVDRTATHPQGFTLGWHIPPFQGESGDSVSSNGHRLLASGGAAIRAPSVAGSKRPGVRQTGP